MKLYMKFRKEWENELSSKKKRDASEDPVAKLWQFRPPNNPQFSIIPKAIFSSGFFCHGRFFPRNFILLDGFSIDDFSKEFLFQGTSFPGVVCAKGRLFQ